MKTLATGIVTALLMAAAPLTPAATIWNGPSIVFSHTPQNALKDQMTPGVAITRGSSGGLYNAVTESSATDGISPKDTQWAVGALTNFSALSYGACPLEQGMRPPNDVGKTYVVHLVTENIYLSLTLTGWGGAGGTGDTTFSYTRTTAPAAPPTPTVSITSPASGAVFAAPANVSIAANASVTNGTVTNVQFLTNGVSLGTVLAAPFSLTASNLAAGSYALTAVATAGGISATSLVVNVSVVNPTAVNLSGSGVSAGQFTFAYATDAGLSYVVESSSNLMNWTPLATNVASGSSAPFSAEFNSTEALFYRVALLPNP